MKPDRPLHLLVVDDNPEDRVVYRRLLAAVATRFTLEERDTGEAGLGRLGADGVDCVLLDYQLPDMDGLEFLGELARRQPDTPPAVVILTGQGDESVAVEAMKLGAQDYLVKERVGDEVLARAIVNAVEKVELQLGVRKRSAELVSTNRELLHEIGERQRVEAELHRTHHALEELVRERTTELERANEELRNANRLKDEFLATLSHELRTPLNAVLGWASVLRGGRLDTATVERAAEVIERNGRAQAQLISDLLDVSGIITGKMRLDLQPVSVPDVLAAVEDSLRPAAAARGIDLEITVDGDLPPLRADPARLQQVVWNLLSNAIKFGRQGGSVRMRAGRANGQIEIEVRDDGIGIDSAFLPYVFDRFRQQDSSTTRAHGGLGLGLAIVRHLVELHGGSVEATSEGRDHGAGFRVRLPLPRAGAGRAAVAEDPPRGEALLAGLRVLVVDDEPDTCELCRTVLEQRGAEVSVAATPAAAFDLFRSRPPDVLISDIGMPGEDGFALLRRIRDLGPEAGGAVPAAALTAYAGAEHAARSLRAGFQQHLAKPVSPDDLVEAVRRLAASPVTP